MASFNAHARACRYDPVLCPPSQRPGAGPLPHRQRPPSYGPLLGDNNDVTPRETDDETLRARIRRRYVATDGLSYKDGASVEDELRHSGQVGVYARGTLGPRNIHGVWRRPHHGGAGLGVLRAGAQDWEYMQMMKFCDPLEYEWQRWMAQTRPVPWDISAF